MYKKNFRAILFVVGICYLTIPEVRGYDDPLIRPNESASHHYHRMRQMEADEGQKQEIRSAQNSMIGNLNRIAQSDLGCAILGINRLYMYNIIGAVGLTFGIPWAEGYVNGVEGYINSAEETAGLVVLGVVVGGIGGWVQKKCCSWTKERCNESCLLKYGGGIVSLIPWAITGVIKGYGGTNQETSTTSAPFSTTTL